MARKIGFGRKNTGKAEAASGVQCEDDLKPKLIKRLIALGLIEAIGFAIVVRGVLTDNLIPIAIGVAWIAIISLLTLRVVLKIAGLQKKEPQKAQGTWTIEEESSS